MDDVPLAREVELVPLVHVQPGKLVAEDDEAVSSESWQERFSRLMARAGAPGLRPAPYGFSCVEAEAIEGRQIVSLLLRSEREELFRWLERGGPGGAREALGLSDALSGGLALVLDGAAFVEPGCCVALDDVADWVALARHRSPGERAVWAGHDLWSLRARYEPPAERLVLVRGGDGYNKEAPVVEVGVSVGNLEAAVARALGRLEALGHRIGAAIAAEAGEGGGRLIGRRLAGVAEIA